MAVEDENGEIIPKIKISENIAKITNPHYKKLYRFYDNESGKAIADELCVYDEEIDDTKPHTIFDPEAVWKSKTLTGYTAKNLHITVYKDGKLVYKLPELNEIKQYCAEQIETLWDEVKRFENPHAYYVDLSKRLWNEKSRLLSEAKKGENL